MNYRKYALRLAWGWLFLLACGFLVGVGYALAKNSDALVPLVLVPGVTATIVSLNLVFDDICRRWNAKP